MNKNNIMDTLHEEICNTDCALDDLDERITDMQCEMSFVAGRRSLAYSLLQQMEEA